MRFVCWINKARETQSENVIVIARLLQQWLPERTKMLQMYIYFPSFCMFSLLLAFNTGHILVCHSNILVHEGKDLILFENYRSKVSGNFTFAYF
jgi:hypothetical protein